MIKVENLNKSFGNKKVLKGINLLIEDGKFNAILGINGAGKSTLINLLLGFSRINSGRITFDKQTRVGIVFQKVF